MRNFSPYLRGGDAGVNIAASAYQEPVTEMLRRCQSEMAGLLSLLERISPANMCNECESLLAQFTFAMLSATQLLEERQDSMRSGIIDNVGFLDANGTLDQVLSTAEDAKSMYFQHRRQHHA
jgi:hypothetical protein